MPKMHGELHFSEAYIPLRAVHVFAVFLYDCPDFSVLEFLVVDSCYFYCEALHPQVGGRAIKNSTTLYCCYYYLEKIVQSLWRSRTKLVVPP